MANDIIGTVRKFTIEGISFRLAGDVNIKRKLSMYENEMVPTSGKAMLKQKRVIPTAESVDLLLNADEAEVLKSFADSGSMLKVSYTTAAGDVHRCVGQINIESLESESGKASLSVLPEEDWTVFPG